MNDSDRLEAVRGQEALSARRPTHVRAAAARSSVVIRCAYHNFLGMPLNARPVRFHSMENARAISAIFLGAFATIFGTWALNTFVVSGLLGDTGREAYSFTAFESLLRFVFYVALGSSIALVAGKNQKVVLTVTAVVSVAVLVMNTHNLMNPEMNASAKVTSYLIAYSPTLTLVPAFVLVGFVFSKWKKVQER